jgi:ketosteroid isomerase-like protein
MYCPACGTKASTDQKFCRYCGLRLTIVQHREMFAEALRLAMITNDHLSERGSPMKQILIICTLAVAVSSLALGQPNDKQVDQKQAIPNSQAEQEVMKLENELVEAGLRGDAATTDRLMADDYFFMTRDGVVHENLKGALLVRMRSGESGADLLARMKSDESDEPMPQPTKIDDTQVHIYGDTGVVIVRSSYKSRGKDGRVIEIPTRYLHVWARRQGRWRLVAGSSTRIEQRIEQTKP